MVSSTVHGFSTWPEMQNNLVPTLFGRPKPANQAAPRRRIVGATAIDVVHGRRAAVDPHARRERRLQTRQTLLAFERLEETGLLPADVSAGAVVDDDLEVPAVLVVLANEAGFPRLIDRGLQMLALADEFAAHVDEARVRPHGEAGKQAALDQRVRVVAKNVAVLAGTRL